MSLRLGDTVHFIADAIEGFRQGGARVRLAFGELSVAFLREDGPEQARLEAI